MDLKRFGQLSSLLILTVLLLFLNYHEPRSSPDWFEFNLPWDDSSSSFLSYPSTGPVTQPIRVGSDSHFHLGTASGPRIRLFGINFGGSGAFLSQDEADKTAKRLAKLGFNFVKFVGLESQLLSGTDPITLNETNLKKMLYFIAKLKENGIYVGIQFNLAHDWHRPSVFFNSHTIKLQKNYIKEVLTYTYYPPGSEDSLTLAEDPVLGQVQFINELYMMDAFKQCDLHTEEECGETSSSSFETPGGTSPMGLMQEDWQLTTPLVPENVNQAESDFLDEEWNKRLLNHYGSRDSLEVAWECTGKIGLEAVEDPDPNNDGDGSDGNVERILYKDWADYCYNRLMDTVTFYYQLTQEHIADMYSYLKDDLGLGNIPITAVENTVGMPDKFAQHATNTMANHDYWIHPKWGGYRYVNAPMVKGPVDASQLTSDWPLWIELRNTIWKATVISAVQDRPFIISENNHPFPNEFQAEFPLLTSAYANFQDWDGIVLHEYGSNFGNKVIDSPFWLADNPAVMAQIPAAARVFRKGWVQAGYDNNELVVPFWEDGEFNGTSGILDDWWNCLGSHYCYWDKIKPGSDGESFTAKGTVTESVSPAHSLVRKTRMKFDTSSSSIALPNTPSSPYESDTGQLSWDMTNGLVRVDAPRVQAAIGFMNTQQVNLSSLTVDATTDFAAISLVSLDGSTIDTSQKLLLTTVSRVMNTGQDPPPPNSQKELTLNSWGGAPVLLQPVKAKVTLTLPQAGTIRVYRLDKYGKKDTQIAYQVGSEITLDIGNHNTLWYGIEIEPTDTAAVFRVTKEGNVLSDKAYYGQGFETGGADLAEYIPVSEPVEPGDVVELDPRNPGHYRLSSKPYSSLVSGVISTQPGFTLGSSLIKNTELTFDDRSNFNNFPIFSVKDLTFNSFQVQHTLPQQLLSGQASDSFMSFSLGFLLETTLSPNSPFTTSDITLSGSIATIADTSRYQFTTISSGNHALLALMGTVPVKATTENGPIKPGDLLTTSSKPGYVMLCKDKEKCAGAIVGKALEPLTEGEGLIEMLVMR